ncbi:hypothetical protein [Spiroplasma sp. AdecLV25b]|uniref:hypothetical protein n=1 Tax=Spiroplasma sp. AdecLV25b TaxID=3027162 RepID=UPI0027DECC59|nr:hypothetical protein [Spiroplasma sp. AdecLV25b]
MLSSDVQTFNPVESNEDNYIVNKKTKRFDLIKKLKLARGLLFWGPIAHIAGSVIFLILLLVDAVVSKKLGFELTKLELALSLSYVGIAVLINVICFMLPAKKLKKKRSIRIIAISTLILSTLILSGSFVFWAIPVLLFFSLITLVIWLCEIIAAIMLILVVEELPNQK